MSLEQKAQALTDALIAVMQEVAGGGAPAKSAPAKSTPAKKTTAKKPAAKKAPTADDIAEAFGSYMKSGDEEERTTAKENVKAIITHFDVERITKLDASLFPEALELLAAFKRGEDPLEEGGEEEGGDLL